MGKKAGLVHDVKSVLVLPIGGGRGINKLSDADKQ